jgi:hypothetical protein
MKPKTGYYKSYLLRMWRESLEGEWRVSLQDVVTCESHHFPNLAALMEYLALETQNRSELKLNLGEVVMK